MNNSNDKVKVVSSSSSRLDAERKHSELAEKTISSWPKWKQEICAIHYGNNLYKRV